MQGPRLPSHASGEGINLPDILPPRNKRPTGRRSSKPDKTSGDEDGETPPPEKDKEKDSYKDVEGGRGSKKEQKTLSRRVWDKLVRHCAFVGPGIIASVAYIDAGNWATDLSAGAQFGYAHLFTIFLAGLIALLFQVLSTRLGCVSDLDLATHCRLALYDRPRHKLLYRWGLLYPLYVIAEIGIIMTDLAELLGSAIAINLLIPAIPLYGAVLLTSLDVFLILILFSQYPTRTVTTSMRVFELFIGALVLVVLASFVALIVRVSPTWVGKEGVFFGYLPGSGIVRGGGLYIATGIIGATVMPHAFFIGSKMATMRRLTPAQYGEEEEDDSAKAALPVSHSPRPHLHLPQPLSLGNFDLSSGDEPKITPTSPSVDRREKPSIACVRAHLSHSVLDVVGSLLGFATVINSAILILAAAVFYYGEGRSTNPDGVSDLFDAYDLVKQYLNQSFATLFAIALLAAGQSASLTVTLSGQIISEGFIEWRTKPWVRRLVTRLIGIIPSLAVAVAVGRQGIDTLLIGSQVALSIVLTFVLIPLIIFTSQHHVMSIPIKSAVASETRSPEVVAATVKLAEAESGATPFFPSRMDQLWEFLHPLRRRTAPAGYVSFANHAIVIWLCIALWILITSANGFALYDVSRGD